VLAHIALQREHADASPHRPKSPAALGEAGGRQVGDVDADHGLAEPARDLGDDFGSSKNVVALTIAAARSAGRRT
jgi:hypothetical protein